MKRGPRPAPTALKLAKGTRSDRIPKGEPKPPAGLPVMPSWLDKEAKAEWKRIAPILAAAGILSPLNGAALAHYCLAHGRVVRTHRELETIEAQTVETQRGGERLHPLVKSMREDQALCMRILAEFGGTPSSLTGIKLDAPAVEDPLSAFINRTPKSR